MMHAPTRGCHRSRRGFARPVGPSNERHTMTDPKTPKTPDQQAFEDAAAHMSQEDWDADNDWLASAGWGEM
jgi:hypothetical protein